MTAKRPLILIVDDAPEDIAVYKRHLTRGSDRRYRIQEAATGAGALVMCRRRAPDCILLDLRLPDLNGLEVLQALAGESGALPCAVVMLAETGDTQIVVNAMKYGAHDFLEKSWITPELLDRAIANAIEKAALQREVEEQRRELAIKNLMLEQRLADLQREVNERQQVEDALRVSEERLRLALGFAGMGMWDLDPAANREVWSAEHFKIMGYPEMPDGAEAPVEWWSDRIHPDDRERCLQAIQDARAKGATYSLEHRIVRADDNRTAWLDVRGRFLRDENGEPTRLLGVIQDITERKQAEEALAGSERRFKRLIEALPGIVWMGAGMEAVTYINDRWTDLTGLTLEQSLDGGWRAAVHPDDAMGLNAEWKESVAAGAPHESRHRFRRWDGEYRWHLCRSVPLRDESGAVWEWVGVCIDIHDRHEAERALSESEARCRALVEATSQLIWTADADGISDISWEWWSEVTGVPVERLKSGGLQGLRGLHGGWIETVHPDDRQALLAAWARSRETQTQFEIGFRLRASDGEYRHFSVRGVPLSAGGVFNGWIGTLDDVTDRRRAEDALKLANERFTIAEAASNGYVYDWDLESGRFGRSAGFNAMLGYNDGENAETSDWWKKEAHPDDIKRVSEMVNQILSSPNSDEMDSYSVEYRVRHKDGRYLWKWDQGKLIRDGAGRVRRVIGCAVDITRRKQIENSLRESESRLKLAIAAINGGTWEWDLVTNELRWSDELYEIFGRRPDSVTPTVEGWVKTMVAEDRPRGAATVEAIRRGEDVQIEYRTTWPDGVLRWLDMRGITLRDEQGRPALVIGITTDITKRKRAEEALRESEARVHMLAANLSDGLIYQIRRDPDGTRRFLYISEGVERLRGVKAEAAMADASTLYNLIPEDYRARMIEAENAAQRDLTDFRFDTPFLLPNGELRWSRQSSTPRRLADGSVVWDGVEIDITERKRAEEALRESEEKFSKVFKASPHRIVIATLDEGRYIDVNEAVLRGAGYEREEMIGYTGAELRIFAESGDREKMVQELQNGPVRDLEVRLQSKSGEVRTVLMSADIITLSGRQCILAISNDITERKRAEEALRESEEKFSKVFKASPHRITISTLDQGRYIDVNDAVLWGSGYERSEMVGHTVEEIRIFAEPDGREKLIQALRNGSVRGLEIGLRSKSGEVRTVLMSAEIITLNEQRCVLSLSNDITERKQTEEALRESEERFRTLANTVPSIIWIAEPDGTITSHNQRWLDYSGVEPGENGDWTQLVIHPDDLERCLAEWIRAGELGCEFETELRLRRRDGEYRWFLARATPALAAEGRVAKWFGVATDIHDRKQAEEARRESDERLKLAMEAAGMFVWETDLVSGRVIWSDFGEQMMGMAPGSFGGTFDAFLALVHPDDRESVLKARKRALDGEAPYEAEYRKVRPDGGVQWGISRGVVHLDEQGHPARLVGVNVDITKRKQMEEALRLSEERYRLLVRTSSNVVITVDETGGNPDSGSGWWERLTGQTWDESRNQGWMKCVHPDDYDSTAATWRKAIAEQESFEAEFRVRTRGGDYCWLHATGAPIRGANGEFREWAVALRDITERKQAEEQLREKERFIQSLIDAVPSGIYIYDMRERRNLFTNPRLAPSLGYTPDELNAMGSDFLPLLLHPEDWEGAHSQFETLRKAPDGSVMENEYRMKHRDGQWRWFVSRELVFLRDADGWPRQILGVAQEITERKEAEEKLREKEKFIQSLVDAVPLGIYIFDMEEMSNVFTNPQLASLLGCEMGEIEALGPDLLPLIIHPEDLERAYEHLEKQRSAPDGAVLETECRVKRRDGQWRWFASRDLVLMRGEDGKPQRILGVTQDITDRKLAEEAIQRANRRYQIALGAFDGYVYEYNVNDRVSERSEGFAKLIGFELEEASKQADWWFDLIHPDDRDRFLSKTEKMLAEDSTSQGESAFSAEYRVRHKEGHYIDVLDRKQIVRDAEGRPAQIVGAVINITERKRAEETLRANAERLRLAMEAANAGSFDWDIASGSITWSFNRSGNRSGNRFGISGSSGLSDAREEARNIEQDYQSWRARVHPEDIDWVEADIAKALAERRNLNIEYRGLSADGAVHWVSNIGHTSYNEAGQPARMQGLMIDVTDRKHAEERLRESEERLRLTLQGAQAGVWEVRFNPFKVHWSKEYRELFGFSETDETTSELWATRVHPDDLQRVVEGNNALLSSDHNEMRQEFRIMHPERGERWILDFVRVRRDPTGRPISFGGINLDVTERKRAEEALRESEERFRNLVETISDVFWIMDPETRSPIYISPAYERLWGRPVEYLYKGLNTWVDAIHPEDRERVKQRCPSKTRESGYDETYRVVRPDGSTVWVHDRGFPVYDDAGNIRHIVGVAEDITDRKRFEDALRESQRRYAALAEAVPQLVWTAEPDGNVDYLNQRWYAYTGTTPDKSLDQEWRSFIHPDDRERVEKILKKGLRAGEPVHVELRLCGADGGYRWFIGRGVPYKDERRLAVSGAESRIQSVEKAGKNGGKIAPSKNGKGRVVKWFGTFTDIHDLKMAEEALRESEERTRRQNAELETLYRAAPVGLALMDRDFRIIRLNETLAEINGVGLDQSLGRRVREVLPELADRLEQTYKRVIRTGRPIMNLEIHGETPREPGVGRDWLTSFYPVKGADGGVQGIGCVVMEITARVRAEAAVRESEERLRLAAQAAGFGLYSVDLQTGANYWSPEMRQVFGLSNDDAVNMDKLLEFVHPDDREKAMRVAEASLDPRGNGEFEIEYRALRPDGSVRWALAMGKTLFAGKGRRRKAARVIGVAFDITERKEAEARLHASEELFRTIFDLSGIGILQADPSTGLFLRANREFRDWLGYSEAELLEMKLEEIAHPDDRAERRTAVERFLRGKVDEYGAETRCVRKDGGVVWGLITSRMLRDAGGAPLRTVTAVQDITERKQFEEALMASEGRYRNLIERANEGIWIVDAEANTLYLNERMANLLGYTAEEIIGRKVPEFCFEQDMAKAVEHINANLRGAYEEFDFRLRRKDGSELHVLASTSPVPDTQGGTVGVMGMFTDITERKQAEEALRESERRLKLSLTAGRAGTWEWRIKDDRLIWSDEYYDLYGMKPGDLEPTLENFLFCVHPEDRDRMLVEMSEVLQERKDAEHEFRFVRPDGAVRWAQSSAQLTLDESGEPERMVGIMIDITTRVQAEMEREELLRKEREARAQAEAANRGKDEFVAMVSHELRSPLNAMLGWSKILKKGGVDAKTQTHAVEVIERSARAQQNLIEDLLDMARIVGGKLRLETRPVSLARVVEAAADVVGPAATAREIDLRVSIKSADEVTGDTDRLQQVVWNLLSNAVKFTTHGGSVEVILERVGPSAQITVTDTGRGIKAEDLPFIFDRFRQADSSSTRRFTGLGLGLALVKHLVELHGGQVNADSPGEGQGASFIVRLPVRAVRGEAAPVRAVDRENLRTEERDGRMAEREVWGVHPAFPLEGVWALIVDDEADARELVATLLRQYGAHVTVAACATEAFEKLRKGEAGARPDVLVSDISMPDEDGYMLIERVRKLSPEEGGKIPAIALTALERPSDRIKALASGFSMHVPKPVEPEELAMVIANLTGHPGERMNVR